MLFTSFFFHSPGGENEDIASGRNEKLENEVKHEGEKKTLGEKIKEALQDWSNDDQRDQEIDDRTP